MKRMLCSPNIVLLALLVACGQRNDNKVSVKSVKPVDVFIIPTSGTGSASLFSLHLPPLKADENISEIRLLFNTALDGRNACYIYYFPASQSLALVKDLGEGASSSRLGSTERLENSQCYLNTSNSAVEQRNDGWTLRLDISFKRTFAGKKNIYVAWKIGEDKPVSFKKIGEWTIP